MSLSEQYLLDCAYDSINSTDPDTGGCDGAWPEQYLSYVAKNGQDQLDKYYPYMAFTFGLCDVYQNKGTYTDFKTKIKPTQGPSYILNRENPVFFFFFRYEYKKLKK